MGQAGYPSLKHLRGKIWPPLRGLHGLASLRKQPFLRGETVVFASYGLADRRLETISDFTKMT